MSGSRCFLDMRHATVSWVHTTGSEQKYNVNEKKYCVEADVLQQKSGVHGNGAEEFDDAAAC